MFEQIYTDGSKDGKKIAAAAVLDGEVYQFRLHPPAGRGVEFAGCRPAEW